MFQKLSFLFIKKQMGKKTQVQSNEVSWFRLVQGQLLPSAGQEHVSVQTGEEARQIPRVWLNKGESVTLTNEDGEILFIAETMLNSLGLLCVLLLRLEKTTGLNLLLGGQW